MRKAMLIAALVVCSRVLQAQQDSSSLELGYFTLNKTFTQQLSIKGSDLEMMPFTNLSDAIRMWLYGGYSVPAGLQYVVDGNPVADVNAYSVHEIDEVILVQSAAATMATAPGQQQLVIIRTKRGRGPGGVCLSAQTGLATSDKKQYSSTTALFHNYFAGAYRNLDKISLGVSGNFIRDVVPYAFFDEKILTPYNLPRWRLNGYFDWRPNDHHRIEVTMNYTPEKWKGQLDSTQPATGYADFEEGHQHFLLPHLDWRASWGDGWTNDVQGTYLHSTSAEYDARFFYFDPNSSSWFVRNNRSYQLWFRDRIAYETNLGKWQMRSAVNLSWQQFRNEESIFEAGGLVSEATAQAKSSVWLVTPTVGLSYKNILDIEGGAIMHPGGKTSLTGNGQQIYPFAAAAVDLLRLSGKPGTNSLKIFGSVASRMQSISNEYMIEDFSNGIDMSFILPSVSYTAVSVGLPGGFLYSRPPVYWTWEGGAAYTGLGGRVQVSFNYESRIFSPIGFDLSGLQAEGYGKYHSSLEHLDLRLKILDRPGVTWRTGLNITAMRFRLVGQNFAGTITPPIGDAGPDPTSWTGGWVNRLKVKDLSLGLDLLYRFNYPDIYGLQTEATTSNVYVAYLFHLPAKRSVQVFAETRGLFVNWFSDLANASQYYTVGANICL